MEFNTNINQTGCTATGKLSTAFGQTTQASGDNSHAEGNSTTASGRNSHAEGYSTTASGNNSHAEGSSTTSSGLYAHAEGNNTLSSGQSSHAEGGYSTASGSYAHAEGHSTLAATDFSHAEGQYSLAVHASLTAKITAFDGAAKTVTLSSVTGLVVGNTVTIKVNNSKFVDDIVTAINGNVITLTNNTPTSNYKYLLKKVTGTFYPTHAEGLNTLASGEYSHSEGSNTVSSGVAAHAEGDSTLASGYASHSEGNGTLASGYNTHAEGAKTEASGTSAHSEGHFTTASGNFSHSECGYTTASGEFSHAEGNTTVASGNVSHAAGLATQARYVQTVIGQFNTVSDASDTTYDAAKEIFIIGNGTGISARGNAFKVLGNGTTYADGAYNSTGADYSEYFEWVDGNVNDEDRVGYFVTLDGDKIRKATASDTYILGITSGSPAIIGDNYEAWQGKYITDEWNRPVYEDVTVPAEFVNEERTRYIESTDEDGNPVQIEELYTETIEVAPERIERRLKLNPDWNPTQEYQSRSERKEWSTVGLLGKLLVRDDGTCQVGQNCYPNDDGIATHSTSGQGYRVMKRTGQNQILVLVK